jgi:exopolysaccharide biosynthesis polyprenyl glycosylphosphotransferase
VAANDHAAFVEGVALYDEVTAVVGDRTLAILEQRRKTATVRRRGWLVRRMLLLADLIGLGVAFGLAEFLSGERHNASSMNWQREVLAFVAILPIWVVVAKLYGLYDHDEDRADHSTADEVAHVFHLVTVGTWILLAVGWATGFVQPGFPKLFTFWALAILLICVGRACARALCRGRLSYLQNTIIVGAGEVGQLVARKLLNHPEYGINLVGFIDGEPRERPEELGHLAMLGSVDRIPAVIRMLDIERVIIAFSHETHQETIELIRSLKDLDVQIDIVPRLFEIVGRTTAMHTVEGLPLVGLPPFNLSRSSRLLKRSMDLVLASVALVLLAPVFAVLAVLIKLDSKGPVFFRQVRMGTRDRTFRIYKFRSMSADAEERKQDVAHLNMHVTDDPRMFKIPNDPRITKMGAFLRRYSLDELPQLINVVRGEMSLVGPRPLILEEDRHVAEWARKRLNLRPGVTGLWQVLGRSDIPFDEMIRLDYLYVTNWSLWNDLRLLFQTVPALTRTRRAY